jgi:hypothetical protein
MNKFIVSLAISLFAVTIWTYRDASGDVCPTVLGCKANANIPCAAGNCIANTSHFCIDTTRAQYVTGTAPTSWTDCNTNGTPKKTCDRKSMLCVTLTLFQRQMDCQSKACGTDDVDECTFNTGPNCD